MAIKTIRVFAEYTSDGYVPMPSQGNIDYGVTVGSTFPETQPSSFQTDDPNIDVAVTTMTDFYVWIRTHGSAWNPNYTRVVRVYPDSPSINSVVMNMIVAVGGGGTTISSGGGVNYYLNGGTSQGVLDGSTYYEMNKVPVEGSGVDFFKINTTGFQNIAQFVTDAGDPGLLTIPAGSWPLGFYMSASDNSGAPKFYAEIYKYSAAGVFTLLGSSVATPEVISNGQAIDYYTSTVSIPDTTLLVTDRIAIRIFVDTDGNRTINLHTQDSHLSTVGTTFTRGLTAINGLIKQVQFLAIGNAGSDAAIVSSDDTHTINLPTASATKRGLLNSTDWSTFNAKQPALSGDGFVKISGSTISYDNSSYQPLDGDLTAIGALAGTSGILKKTGANTWELDTSVYLSTTDAATTYQRKDNMASNLLASDTQYPSNNAVLAKLALKANAANPQFTGSMNIKGAESRINFYDENDAIKYFIGYDSGFLRIYQNAGSASRLYINTDGKTFIPGTLEVGSIIKSSGTSSQFLKADGSVDSNTYVSSTALADYLLSATAASTYQRLDNMAINLLASDTQYPNNNAVIAALALKANAANPTFTGNFTISGDSPKLYFVDTDNNPDYTLFTDSGYFYIYDQTAGATKFQITPSGNAINTGTLTSASFIKSGGTSSQFLMGDGSVSTNPGWLTSYTETDTLATVTSRGSSTTLSVKFGSYVDINPTVSAFRFYDGTTFRGGFGLDSWASNGGSDANLNVYVNGDNTLFFSTSGTKRASLSSLAFNSLVALQQNGNQVIHAGNISSQSVNYATSAGSVAWSGVTGKPTTLSGYGITDAASINGDVTKQFNAFEFSFNDTLFNPSAASRTIIDAMSIKMFRNYFTGTGMGSDYGTVLQYYSQAGHVESQVYFDAAGGSWYRTASYNANYGSWQRYLTDINYSNWALPITGGSLSGKLQINANYAGTNPERFTIRGTYPSIGLRSTQHDMNWLIHNEDSLSFYSAAGVDSDAWGRRFELNTSGVLKLNGHITLTAGNYTSYSPSLTGYGASGTWGINISGSSDRTYRGIIEDTRGGQRTPDDYEDYRVSFEFTNQITSGWRTALTMQGWHNGYTAWQIIGPSDTSANEQWYLRSGVNTSWNSLRSIIHSGNIGSQSVTYADNAGAVGTVGESRIVYGENSTATTSISNATLNGALKSGFYTVGSGGIPNATGVTFVMHTAYAGVGNLAGFDLACNDSTTSDFYLRPATGGGKGAWQTIITSATIGSQSVSYSSTAGLLNALSSYVWNINTPASSYHQGISASFVRSEVDGFPSYGSVMTVRTYSGAMGSLQLYTPYSPTYGGYRLRYRSSNYDTGTWDGWKDLLNSVNDPYAYNMNQYVRTTDTPTFQDVYTNGWFRNNANNAGLYSTANNVHFYSTSDGYWNMGGGGRANGALVFRQDHQTTLKGYVYWDASGFGLLNNQGGWSVMCYQGTGYGGELRGSWGTKGDFTVGSSGSSTIYMVDTDEGTRQIHCNSNRIGFLNQSASWGSWCNDDGSWEATKMYAYNGLSNNQDVSTDRARWMGISLSRFKNSISYWYIIGCKSKLWRN